MYTATRRSASVCISKRNRHLETRLRVRRTAMNADQFRRAVQGQIGYGAPSSLTLAQLCAVCQELTSFPASIVLSVSNQPQAAAAASDGAGVIEQLQLTLGEGPGVDAY